MSTQCYTLYSPITPFIWVWLLLHLSKPLGDIQQSYLPVRSLPVVVVGVAEISLQESDQVWKRNSFVESRRSRTNDVDRCAFVVESFDDVAAGHIVVFPGRHAKYLPKSVCWQSVCRESMDVRERFAESGPECPLDLVRLHTLTDFEKGFEVFVSDRNDCDIGRIEHVDEKANVRSELVDRNGSDAKGVGRRQTHEVADEAPTRKLAFSRNVRA